MAQDKPLVRLWALHGIGLIITHPSGVTYANQTGGYACKHPKMEGVFVPLVNPEIDQQTALEDHFTGPKWGGHCYRGIDAETADVVDAILANSTLTRRLKVNREKLADSEEAWVHVLIASDEEVEGERFEEFLGFFSGMGVITWKNSD